MSIFHRFHDESEDKIETTRWRRRYGEWVWDDDYYDYVPPKVQSKEDVHKNKLKDSGNQYVDECYFE